MTKILTHKEVSSRGGIATAKKMTKEQRIERARKASWARYKKLSPDKDLQSGKHDDNI